MLHGMFLIKKIADRGHGIGMIRAPPNCRKMRSVLMLRSFQIWRRPGLSDQLRHAASIKRCLLFECNPEDICSDRVLLSFDPQMATARRETARSRTLKS